MYVSLYYVTEHGAHELMKVVERQVRGMDAIFPRHLVCDLEGKVTISRKVVKKYAAMLTGYFFCYCIYHPSLYPMKQKKSYTTLVDGIHVIQGGRRGNVNFNYSRVVRYRVRGDLSVAREDIAMDEPELLDILASPGNHPGGVSTEQYEVSGVANTSLISYEMHSSGKYCVYRGISDVWCCAQSLPHYVSETRNFVDLMASIQHRTITLCMGAAQIVFVNTDQNGEHPMQRRKLVAPNQPMRYWERNMDRVLSPIIADDPRHPKHKLLMPRDIPQDNTYSLHQAALLAKRFGFVHRLKACDGRYCHYSECSARRKRKRVSIAMVSEDSSSTCSQASTDTCFSDTNYGNTSDTDGMAGHEDCIPHTCMEGEYHILWNQADVVDETLSQHGANMPHFSPPAWKVPCAIPELEFIRCEDTALQYLTNPSTVEVPRRIPWKPM